MRRFFKGFVYAGRGIAACVRSERNFRFHLWAGVLVFWLAARYYPLTRGEWAALALTVALVLALEAVNSAVERAVAKPDAAHDAFAGLAKDMAAGAVLLAALGAVAVGLALFWRPAVFGEIWVAWRAQPLRAVSLAGYFAAGAGFVFAPEAAKRKPADEKTDRQLTKRTGK